MSSSTITTPSSSRKRSSTRSWTVSRAKGWPTAAGRCRTICRSTTCTPAAASTSTTPTATAWRSLPTRTSEERGTTPRSYLLTHSCFEALRASLIGCMDRRAFIIMGESLLAPPSGGSVYLHRKLARCAAGQLGWLPARAQRVGVCRGTNVAFERRYAEGKPELFPEARHSDLPRPITQEPSDESRRSGL